VIAGGASRSLAFRSLAYGSLCLSCALILLELVIRASGFASHLYTEPAFELSPRRDYWRYRPGLKGQLLGPTQVLIGPSGYRANTYSASTVYPASLPIIAIFGDSVTLGQGIDSASTFAARLEEELAAAGLRTKVLNCGVQGHTVEMELAHLADRLPEVHPDIVIWAFVSDDLNPERAQNHVDRFGYLTKNALGRASFWGDAVRAALRHSHVALLMKESIVRIQAGRKIKDSSNAALEDGQELSRFRSAVRRLEELTPKVGRIVICLDLRETRLTSEIRGLMKREFPEISFIYSSEFMETNTSSLTVPRDGHPNELAHAIYGAILLHPIVAMMAHGTIQN